MNIRWFLPGLAALASVATLQADLPRHPKFGFPVYTNRPSGRQLAGQHAPAGTPALSPAEAQKKFTLPPGFEIRLFAAEPDVVNPVAMCWDDRGRLWVLELYEYPLGAKPGEPGRDRVKILEDTDGDGRVDKVTVFADGFNLATGLLVANDGVYVGAAPNLYFLQDTDGDGVADKRTIVQTGFGLEDRHELLNGFVWGPDGQMYLTHGVFTQTRAVNPDQPADPVVVSAGVARFHPKTHRLEVFAEGTSNPWGVDFDAGGNAFVSACVIDHFFHLAPGGLYQRQAGQPPYPYAYELLPSIVDHRHHMAAYAGVAIYQGDQFPAEYRGMALMGNIHDNSIHQDRLTPAGSTFKASFVQDFVRANDGWFMPVSTQVGPDGAVWIMDWYDRYPCYQNANADPDGVDRERGRIWRVVHTGDQPGRAVPSRPAVDLQLSALKSPELVRLLSHPNVWQRRMAQRILSGRHDASTRPALGEQVRHGTTPDARLAALWTLYSSGLIDHEVLDDAADSDLPVLRQWAARLTGEWNQPTDATFRRLKLLAGDESPLVPPAVATALRQFVSGSLTVNTPPRADSSVTAPAMVPIIERLLGNAKKSTDRDLPFLLWMALEPVSMYDPSITAKWYEEKGERYLPLSGRLLYKTIRRYCDARETWLIDKSLELVEALPAESALQVSILDGLLEGQRGKAILPKMATEPVLKRLLASSNPDVVARAQQLGALWGDVAALHGLLLKVNDAAVPEPDRIQAITAARKQKNEDTRRALHAVLGATASDALKVAAVRALAEVGVDDTGRELVAAWPGYTPAVQRAVAELTATRWQWYLPFLGAIERGDIKRGDVPPSVVRAYATSGEPTIRAKAEQLFGKVNGTSADKLKLIAEKRKVVAEGAIDLAAGHEVARKTCLICHKLHGEGADVGPDLTGVGRSSLDALLHNVIHPNEIIGQGYENVVIETRDDRTISGRVVENSATQVRVVMAGPAEEVIAKTDVKSLTVTPNSVMPEGLEQMPDADFRNLIWYILAPPQDGKPLTPARRQELINAGGDQAGLGPQPASDGESIALWNPAWRVECPDFEDAPRKYPEFAGRRNVLMTHPVDRTRPSALVHKLDVPAGQKAVLRFAVAAHERGDWELRVVADGEVIHRQVVNHDGERWKDIRLDVSRYAGRRVVLRLENAANDWAWEFGYWADLRLEVPGVAAQ